MSHQVEQALEALNAIRSKLQRGMIEYDAAKAEAQPHLEVLNARGREIAKEHKQPYYQLTFSCFMG